MSRTPQHFADRLRSALRVDTHHTRPGRRRATLRRRSDVARDVTVAETPATDEPGEQFARRLRAAIDA